MAKLGAHVVFGSRNYYGEFVAAKPALVVAMGEGGALVEAKQKSGGHTITVYRHTFFKDAPQGIDQNGPQWATDAANSHYGSFKAKWSLNPADYYTIINEPAGSDLGVLPSYLAYERRFMELAERDNIKLCVLNLAMSTPESFAVWKEHYVPHILRAFQGGHIYGRHHYTHLPGNLERSYDEAAYLYSLDRSGGIAFTELGPHDNQMPGETEFIAFAVDQDQKMRQHNNIIGGALWTLGNWSNANWQGALPEITQYLLQNPTPQWKPGEKPDNQTSLSEFLWKNSLETQIISLNDGAAIQKAIVSAGLTPVGNEIWVEYNGESYAYQTGEDASGDTRAVFYAKVPNWGDIKRLDGIVEPEPEPEPEPDPTPPPSTKIDMAQFFVPPGDLQFSDIVIIKNNWGQGDERVQLQTRFNSGALYSLVTKNQQWEMRRITSDGIWLVMDTSPDDTHYYVVDSNTPWIPRQWSPGATHDRVESTQFFRKDNCSVVVAASSAMRNQIKFVALHNTYTTPGNITFNTVTEIVWLINGSVEETYYYAKNIGLIEWKNRAGRHSWVHERVKLGDQENNRPKAIDCHWTKEII